MYQRNLYTLAVDLAQKSGMDAKQQNVIYRKYGDHLYQKGDYDGAMTQYIKAIDSTEPSQVIRKFLDTQRIHNLIEYLEELHEHHKATSDHTTLLLNCYAKLKDIDKLEKFIKSPGDLKFDLDTAISMCRQGSYYDQAAYLAKKHGEHDLVVDILIEDSKAYKEALDYIAQQDPETVSHIPGETPTSLLTIPGVLVPHEVCPRAHRTLPERGHSVVYRLLHRAVHTEDTVPNPNRPAPHKRRVRRRGCQCGQEPQQLPAIYQRTGTTRRCQTGR